MNKELQDLVWSILPKEFKEEVKYEYRRVATKASKEEYDLGFMHAHEGMFGIHNLPSDTEGEEMLTVSRKRLQEEFETAKKIGSSKMSSKMLAGAADMACKTLDNIFGSKCLSDDGDEVTKEPKPAEPNPDGDELSPERQPANRTPSSYTQPVTNCPQIDRLHIAAMAMQGILSNTDRLRKNVTIGSGVPFGSFVAREALHYADALIAESHK